MVVQRYPEFEHGDKITVSGKLGKPENTGSFNYQNYLLKDGIYFTASYPKIELLGKDKNNILHWLIALKKDLSEISGKLSRCRTPLSQMAYFWAINQDFPMI